jgi:hypothetical protein
MENFKRPKGEKPYYYASSINKNGKVIQHKGNKKYAMYKSEMDESSRRANLWHKWIEKNNKKAYNGLGIMDDSIYAKNQTVLKEFMDGVRSN